MAVGVCEDEVINDKGEGDERWRRVGMNLLEVGVEGGVVHEPLQAAIIVFRVGTVVTKGDVDGLNLSRWSSGPIMVQGYGHLERILSSRLEE